MGELLIAAAILIGLWLVYENFFTNAIAASARTATANELTSTWKANAELQPKPGQPFALLYIPKLKAAAWSLPIVEGVDQSALGKGAGHYPQSDLPGQTGNFAVAGHRVTHGQPFYDFPKLATGDSVFVRTGQAWYEYKLFATKFVKPADYFVVTRNPGISVPSQAKSFSIITLTTCDPAWNSFRRWIWWGTLVGTYSLASDPVGLTP